MILKFRTGKIGLILLVLLLSSLSTSFIDTDEKIVDTASAQLPKLITFNSYVDMEYDTTPLSKPLAIDVSVTMPISIKFWTDIPDVFSLIPFPINFLILYGQPIGPMQTIHLEILETPSWANIYISSPDVLSEIPIGAGTEELVTTNLIVSPRVEAPAESYKIDIRATCESLGRLNGFSYQESIEFTPSFIPTTQITINKPIRTVGPHESVNFNIEVKNLGNKITKVTPKLIRSNPDWTPTINPPEIEIDPNDDGVFTFSIVSPYDFGWHNEYQSFEIQFRSEVYPYREGAANNTKNIFLVLNNYGFSTPGFEILTVIIAGMFIAFIYKKRKT